MSKIDVVFCTSAYQYFWDGPMGCFLVNQSYCCIESGCYILGLCFIGDNSACIMDHNCDKPAGFSVIFPRMIRLGIELGLEFPPRQFHVKEILHLQEIDLRRLVKNF